jgi:hypothetical protein
MRKALCFLIAALPLMGRGDASFWEREADNAPRHKAPELYARAIEAYGDARPPKTADIVRCLEKLPWEAVSAGEFKRLTRQLSPLLRRKHSKAELVAWKKRILTKYRLLQVPGEADVASGEAGYDVPVIQTRTLSLRMAEIRSVELAEHGPGWRTSSDLVAEWEAYWRAVRRLLDRRERWQERMRYGR